MADNYTQFAEEFVPCSDAQASFILDAFKAAQKDEADEWIEENGVDVGDADAESFLSGVACEKRGGALHIWSESDGDLEHVAVLVAAAQRRFGDSRPWTAEAAFTCSSSRPGEFGGCAVFIHNGDARWLNTAQWAREQMESALFVQEAL